MPTKQTARWQNHIQRIKEALVGLGEMRPGSLSEQYNVCGNPTCRCKDANNPRKHGPYYQLSFTHKGKSTTEFVKREAVTEVRRQLKNYQRFKKLVDKWVELSVDIAKAQRKHAGR